MITLLVENGFFMSKIKALSKRGDLTVFDKPLNRAFLFGGDMASRGIKDLTGKVFNRLTAIRVVGKSKSDRAVLWLCHCKCGNEKIVKGTDLSCGHTQSCGCLQMDNRIKQGHANSGSNSGRWVGNNVGYNGIHTRMKKIFPKPDNCSSCNKKTTVLDLSNNNHLYKDDINDWEWLCKKCHMIKDKIMRESKKKRDAAEIQPSGKEEKHD